MQTIYGESKFKAWETNRPFFSYSIKSLLTGKPIHKNDLKKQEKIETGKIVCIFSDDKFIGMYKVVNSGDVFAKAEFVMQPIGK